MVVTIAATASQRTRTGPFVQLRVRPAPYVRPCEFDRGRPGNHDGPMLLALNAVLYLAALSLSLCVVTPLPEGAARRVRVARMALACGGGAAIASAITLTFVGLWVESAIVGCVALVDRRRLPVGRAVAVLVGVATTARTAPTAAAASAAGRSRRHRPSRSAGRTARLVGLRRPARGLGPRARAAEPAERLTRRLVAAARKRCSLERRAPITARGVPADLDLHGAAGACWRRCRRGSRRTRGTRATPRG